MHIKNVYFMSGYESDKQYFQFFDDTISKEEIYTSHILRLDLKYMYIVNALNTFSFCGSYSKFYNISNKEILYISAFS